MFSTQIKQTYKKYNFYRQQSQHLGQTKKRRDSREVSVTLHNATATVSRHGQALSLVYSVRVAGKLVPAATAAGDMCLLSDKEVVAELGYPLVTKAEREYTWQWQMIIDIFQEVK